MGECTDKVYRCKFHATGTRRTVHAQNKYSSPRMGEGRHGQSRGRYIRMVRDCSSLPRSSSEVSSFGCREGRKCKIRFHLPMEHDKQRLHDMTRNLIRDVKHSREWLCEFCGTCLPFPFAHSPVQLVMVNLALEYRPYCSRDAGDDAHLDAPLTPKDGHLRTSPTLAVAWGRALLIVARVRGRSTTSATTTASSASRSSRSITTHSICSTTARRASSRGRGASGPGTGTHALAAVRDARRTPHRAWRSSDAASASSPGTAGEHVCDVGRP